MNAKLLIPAALALSLSIPALSSIAATSAELLGQPAPPKTADRTIEITPKTHVINVEGGEIVNFDVGGRTFAWDFNGANTVQSVDLNQIAPGLIDHPVRVRVGPNPLYQGAS